MKITVKLSGSGAWTRQQVIKQYASLEQTISFDDEKRERVFMRICGSNALMHQPTAKSREIRLAEKRVVCRFKRF